MVSRAMDDRPALCPPSRLAQFLGPQPAPLKPTPPLWRPLLPPNARFPGEHELHAAEPGRFSALPPYPDDVFGGKPRPVKMDAFADEPLSTGGRHG